MGGQKLIEKSALVQASYAIIHLHSYALSAKVEEAHAGFYSAYPSGILRIDVHACWRSVVPETGRERIYVKRKARLSLGGQPGTALPRRIAHAHFAHAP